MDAEPDPIQFVTNLRLIEVRTKPKQDLLVPRGGTGD